MDEQQKQKMEELGHSHIMCPFCYHQFNYNATGLYTNIVIGTPCPNCTAKIFSMPVVFTDTTPEKVQKAVSMFLEAQAVSGKEVLTRPVGETLNKHKKND